MDSETAGTRLMAGARFDARLLDEITTGLLVTDESGQIAFANRMALETLQLPVESCLGRPLVEVFGHKGEVARAVRDAAGGGERRVEFILDGQSGRRLEVGMAIRRATADAYSDVGFVVLFRDLGDRRQIELELRRVERLTAIGNMVAGFAHEVRNPLAGIQALAEALVAETGEDDPRREYGSRMLGLLARVERFVKASLEFAEPKAPERRAQPPGALAVAALEALAPRWGWAGVPPTLTVDADAGSVDVDKGQIVEALLALIENAIDSTQDASRVRVHVGSIEAGESGMAAEAVRNVRIDVSDDGPGIPAGLLSRIFDPFFTTKARGTGLGLPLAQTLVRENGGRLTVRSQAGVETLFSILLPEQLG